MNSSQTGKQGEEIAEKYLVNLGYKILQNNFHSRFGEIDIIAKDEDSIVFVEVKARSNDSFGKPLEAIGSKKLFGLIKTGQLYLLKNKWSSFPYRFDAIEVILSSEKTEINHIKNITL